jgi:hypothetical protein
MRRIFFRIAILIVALALLLSLWVFAGRGFSLFVDQIATGHEQSQSIDRVTYSGDALGGTLGIAGASFSTAGRDLKPFPLTLHENPQHQFDISFHGKSFLLGPVSLNGSEFRIAQGSGDKVSFDTRRSLLSWPTPFEVNFMTGHSPSWKRNLYYILDWRKPSGQRLQMTWRYEQYFYPNDGWASGFMTREGATGLIRVDISP